MVAAQGSTANRGNTMYTFTNTKTGKTYKYATLKAANRAKDRQDSAYGSICTTFAKFVEAK